MRCLFIALLLAAMLAPSSSFALTVKIVEAGQKGKIAYLKYNLEGLPGEREAEVVAELEVLGNKYSADQISVGGDVGSGVKVGRGKMITWNVLKDMPAGFEGKVLWTIQVRAQEPTTAMGNLFRANPGLQKDGKTIFDPQANLMWPLDVSKGGTLETFADARDQITYLNSIKFAGCDDWRIPTKAEWGRLAEALSVYGYKSGTPLRPWMEKVGFRGGSSGYFWTSELTNEEPTKVVSKTNEVIASAGVSGGSNSYYRTTRNGSSYSRSTTTYGSGTATGYANIGRMVDNPNATNRQFTAVISGRDGFTYKKELVTKDATLLPVRTGGYKYRVEAGIKVTE